LAIAADDINAKERATLAIVFFIRVPRLLHKHKILAWQFRRITLCSWILTVYSDPK